MSFSKNERFYRKNIRYQIYQSSRIRKIANDGHIKKKCNCHSVDRTLIEIITIFQQHGLIEVRFILFSVFNWLKSFKMGRFGRIYIADKKTRIHGVGKKRQF